MERVLTDMMTYNENISMILDGKMPVVRTFISSDSLRTSKILVKPSAADSALRIQMEGDGPYSLAGGGGITPQSPRRAIELVTPIDGIVTDHYDIKEGRFGVKVAAAAGDPVTAIDEGTVVISRWTPETGHIIEIQHTNSLLSIYRHLSQKDIMPFPGSDTREFWQRAEERTQHTAQLYDALGMAEYQAIEVFVKMF